MNAVGMILPQAQMVNTSSNQTKTANAKANVLGFEEVLSNQQNTKNTVLQESIDENTIKSTTDELTLLEELSSLLESLEDLELDLPSLEDLKKQIEQLLKANDGEETALALVDELRNLLEIALDESNQAEEANLINELLLKLNNVDTSNELEGIFNGIELQQLGFYQLDQLLGTAETADVEAIQKQLAEIFKTVETLLPQLKTEQDIKNASPKLLELLQQWSQLESKLGRGNNVVNLSNEETNLSKVWKDLVQSYERREQIGRKQQYNTDAKVTTTDVAKWLDKALENHPLTEKVTVSNMNLQTSAPMSKLEQYVIHINQTQSSQSASGQLLDQFQQVMKTSKFLALPNGTNQLSISLNPNNLGEMMVRLTQIDGEMTVKILVTTQAAKEMLEANMKQLKHMFSPQQVVIEKQDVNVQQAGNTQKGQNEQQYNDEQDQSNQSEPEKHHHDEGQESEFREMLMNVKV